MYGLVDSPSPDSAFTSDIDLYQYRADLVSVVDGDTIDYLIDFGFDLSQTWRLRLSGIDTAETHGVSKDSDEYQMGSRQADYVRDWHDVDSSFIVISRKKGKYGRFVGSVLRTMDDSILNDSLVEEFGDDVRYK